MNLFRLVLCLTGLAIYLVVKQYVTPETSPEPARPMMRGTSPEAQQSEPRSPRPQTTPHQFLKTDKSYADAGR